MWSDAESDKDFLNFGEVAQIAVDIITSTKMLPVSIGIFGNWGAGKSSVLKLIEGELARQQTPAIVIRFDAWLYQGYDDARAALLEVIATDIIRKKDGDTKVFEKVQKLLSRLDIFRTIGLVAEGAAMIAGIPTGGLISKLISGAKDLVDGVQTKDEYDDLIGTVTDGKEKFAGIIKPESKKSPPQQIDAFRKEYEELIEVLGCPLVVIIDNLDRCLPNNAIHTLEAIRLFLFLKNTAFVIAADEEMIRSAVADYFKGASERHQIDYLDKLIQIPIRVPKAGIREIRSFLFLLYALDLGVGDEQLEILRQGLEEALQRAWRDDPITRDEAIKLVGKAQPSGLSEAFELAERIAPILASSPMIQGNPRVVKRLLNVVKMRSSIARRRSMPIDEAIITKLVIFERCVGADGTADFYRLIDSENGKPSIITELENNSAKPSSLPSSWESNPSVLAFIKEWVAIAPQLKDIDLRPAVYLSRETVPIGNYLSSISPTAREVLQTLATVSSKASPTAKKAILKLPREEQVPVMEALINGMRQVTDWASRPKGFYGACLLASVSSDAAKLLLRFLHSEPLSKSQPPWLATALKGEAWNKE